MIIIDNLDIKNGYNEVYDLYLSVLTKASLYKTKILDLLGVSAQRYQTRHRIFCKFFCNLVFLRILSSQITIFFTSFVLGQNSDRIPKFIA